MRAVNTPLEIRLYDMLKRISHDYMTPPQLRRDAKNGVLDYEEYLEMSYENIQADARRAIHGLRIKRP